MVRPVPLNNVDHGASRVITARGAAFGDGQMYAPVFPYAFYQMGAAA